MAWDVRLNPVVDALSRSINDQDIIWDIAVKSGLKMEYVRKAPDSAGYWTRVLDRAQDEGEQRVDLVLNMALTRTDNPLVHKAAEVYWKERGK